MCWRFISFISLLADRAVQKLAVVLTNNGIRLQDLSPQQISSLTGLIKLLQSQSKHDENMSIPEKGLGQLELEEGGKEAGLCLGRGWSCCWAVFALMRDRLP